jgi:ATP-dependent Clp protease ATP-binding subunit ClpC
MFERFNEGARAVVINAQEEAGALRHDFMGTEHLLLGMLDPRIVPDVLTERGVAHDPTRAAVVTMMAAAGVTPASVRPDEALASIGIDMAQVRRSVEQTFGPHALRFPRPAFTTRAKRVLELSLREALQLGQFLIGVEHLLLGLIAEREGTAARVLVELGVDPDDLRRSVVERISPEQIALARLGAQLNRLSAHVLRLGDEDREWATPILHQLNAQVRDAYGTATDTTQQAKRDLVEELRRLVDGADRALQDASITPPG